MGAFDKLMFWKKGDDFAANPGKEFGMDAGLGGIGQDNLGMPGNDFGMPQGNDMGLGQNQDFSSNPGFSQAQGGYGSSSSSYGQNQSFGQSNAGDFPRIPERQSFQQQTQMAPPGFSAQQPVTVMPQQPIHQEYGFNMRDLELISYKLDTLKAALDMVNQRLANIERMAMNSEDRKRSW